MSHMPQENNIDLCYMQTLKITLKICKQSLLYNFEHIVTRETQVNYIEARAFTFLIKCTKLC